MGFIPNVFVDFVRIKMDTTQAKNLAIELINQHVPGYSFSWNRSKRVFGTCEYTRKLITLSYSLVSLNEELHVKDTILHEIAHAFAGRQNGHNRVWKWHASRIGANPIRCYDSNEVVMDAKYFAKCKCNNKIHKKIRRPRVTKICIKCRERLVWFTGEPNA
jgi:predicted SprT family Zn-dependent metalloprotease